MRRPESRTVDASTAEAITAIGTVIAAVGTVGALIFAARAASAASDSARAANAAVASETRPLLLDVPRENYRDGEHEFPWGNETRKSPMRGQILADPSSGTFVFPVRNVGRGAARIEHFTFGLVDAGDDATYSQYSGDAVPVGEDAWLSGSPEANDAVLAALRKVPSPTHGPMPYVFTATYTDIAGKQRQRLELGVGTIGRDSALRVIRTTHVALDADD
jgi:hypothetical protein